MLEHADGKHPVELAAHIVVVLHADLDGKPGTTLAREVRLLPGDGQAHAAHAVVLGEVAQGLAPAAADVEHTHARRELQLARDQVELGDLRGVELGRLAPISAAVDQARAQHGAVEIVAQVVVALADLERAPPALAVEQPRTQGVPAVGPADDGLLQPRAQQAREHLVQRLAVPGAFHVGLAKCERAVTQQAGKHARVVDTHVPGVRPVYKDVGPCKNSGDGRLARERTARRRGGMRGVAGRGGAVGSRMSGLGHGHRS